MNGWGFSNLPRLPNTVGWQTTKDDRLPYGLSSDGFLGGREVAHDLVLPDRVDDQFVRQAPTFGGVELDRLIDTLVLLQGELVVRHHLHAVPVLLHIGILEK